MTSSPPQTLLEHMHWLAAELNCVVVYRLGMFHFIPHCANPTTAEIATSVESASHLLRNQTLSERVAEAFCLNDYGQPLSEVGSYLHTKMIDRAEMALDACHAVELVAILKRLTAPYTGNPDGEPLEAIISDADDLLAKLESKS